ncbi:hypothetical protein LOAG_18894 [Loa loa]|uniref:Uncharacterized protein n=1 Tax=Loa loa TaxID=7209 RepID=A0A1S0UE46_LOALO|nr:hypothetical protein LOAG_18894 [Loa loa]EJD73696.1 hypothetical protein LOAG_18894 [Loa loa]
MSIYADDIWTIPNKRSDWVVYIKGSSKNFIRIGKVLFTSTCILFISLSSSSNWAIFKQL